MNNKKQKLIKDRIEKITYRLNSISSEYPSILEAIVFGSSINLNNSFPNDIDIAIVIDNEDSKKHLVKCLEDFDYTGKIDFALNYCPHWELKSKELPIHFIIISEKGKNYEEDGMWHSINKGYSIWEKESISNKVFNDNQLNVICLDAA